MSCCVKSFRRQLYNKFGHPGRERTTSLIKDRFYWIGMHQDIENWVKNCNRCVHRKSTNQRAPLVNIQSSYPLELVCMDFLTLKQSKGGYQHILVSFFISGNLKVIVSNKPSAAIIEKLQSIVNVPPDWSSVSFFNWKFSVFSNKIWMRIFGIPKSFYPNSEWIQKVGSLRFLSLLDIQLSEFMVGIVVMKLHISPEKWRLDWAVEVKVESHFICRRQVLAWSVDDVLIVRASMTVRL